MRILSVILLGVALLLGAASCRTTGGGGAAGASAAGQHVVKVKVTGQAYDFLRPWQKKPPASRTGYAVVVGPQEVLVTAALVENATYIQCERVDGNHISPARVKCVDYQANLAVLTVEGDALLKGLAPMPVADDLPLGAAVSTWQFEENGTPYLTPGELRTVEVSAYPYDAGLLVYQVETSLSRLTTGFTVPVVADGRLAGLVMNYNTSTRLLTLVPAPVVRRFLADLGDGKYDGIPRAGFSFEALTDPQLRRYAQGPAGDRGVYVSQVRGNGPAGLAGMQAGDVLLAIDGHAVSARGEYEEPRYGRLNIAHLPASAMAGSHMVFRISRAGQEQDLTATLQPLAAGGCPVPPYVLDEAPRYLIVGGFVLQELSRQYLAEWGGKWETKAPQRLVYYDHRQWELFKPDQRVVILSQSLPTAGLFGYEGLRSLWLKKVNDQPVQRLEDVEAALAKPVPGQGGRALFHRFEFDQNPNVIYLDAQQLAAINADVQRRYGLPSLRRL